MKFKRLLRICLVLSLAIFGCGKVREPSFSSPKIKSFSGIVGTCTISGPSMKMCVEFSYSGTLAEDPSTSMKAEAQKACHRKIDPTTSTQAVFAEGQTCSRSAALGFCTHTSTVSDRSQSFSTKNVVVFDPPFTTTDAQAVCAKNFKGTYSAATP